jgi:carboxymethylenebutenolidase
MAETIKIKTAGGSFDAHMVTKRGGNGRGLLLIQEIFGINQVMQDLAQDFSMLGYTVVCPDLFWRIKPGIRLDKYDEAEWKQAFEYFQKFDVDKGVEDLKATLAHMRGMREITGKTGCVGYCLGGKLAYLMMTRSDIDAGISYYGVGIEQLLGEAGAIKKPYMTHIAAKDKFVPPEAQAKVKATLSQNPLVEINVFEEQDHAFARVGGDHWDAQAARIANEMTTEFLAKALA